jgi:hypothetical protein
VVAAISALRVAAITHEGFEKIVLTDLYYCDGIATGDFNRDGKIDLVAGPFWYAGPDFKQRHQIWPQPKAHLPAEGASNSVASFVHDFNGDGWPDVLVLGRVRYPADYQPIGWEKVVMHDAHWYANPGTGKGPWARHFVFPRVMGESPELLDIDGDGSVELLTLWDNRWGLLRPNRERPVDPWKFQPITREGEFRVYYHGTGAGDVNGDGRIDLVLNEGCWLQPSRGGTGLWEEHAFRLSAGRGGAQIPVYDVNGDGRVDLVSALDGHGWGLSWFERLPTEKIAYREHRIMGDRAEEKDFGVAFSQVHALAAADVDGDGLRDIVTGKRWWAHGPKADKEPEGAPVLYWFQLLRENGAVRFVPHLIDDESGVGTQISVEDVTGDGRPDILTASKRGTFVFVNRLKSGAAR